MTKDALRNSDLWVVGIILPMIWNDLQIDDFFSHNKTGVFALDFQNKNGTEQKSH